MSDTIQDDLREAFAEHESEEVDDSTSSQPARDEAGKFVAKKEETETEAAARLQPESAPGAKVPEAAKPAGEVQAEPEGQWTQDKAPQSWTPAAREKWATLPEDIRKEIVRREEASVMGVRKLRDEYAPVENFIRGIEPFIQEAQQSGVQPEAYIGSVLQSERVLRRADLPTKFQEILRIADQYGVPLRDIINQSVGQQVLQAPQQHQQAYIPPQVAQELQEMRQWRQQFETQGVNSEVETFSKDKEFFGDVRNVMANLIESGTAATLQDAYDQACWGTPQVRAVLLERERTGGKKQELQQRQQKAAGASLTPSGQVEVALEDDDDDLAATIRNEFAKAQSGRA